MTQTAEFWQIGNKLYQRKEPRNACPSGGSAAKLQNNVWLGEWLLSVILLFGTKNTKKVTCIKKLYGIRFILPAFILYTVLYIIPTIAGMVISMTDWNVTRPDIQFIGLQNFVDIFTSKGGNYLASIGHTFEFTVVTVTLKTLLAWLQLC